MHRYSWVLSIIIASLCGSLASAQTFSVTTYRPSTGSWYINSNDSVTETQWGLSGDIPVPGDYDGDGITIMQSGGEPTVAGTSFPAAPQELTLSP